MKPLKTSFLAAALTLSAANAFAQPALPVTPNQPAGAAAQLSVTPATNGKGAPGVTVSGAPGLVVTPGPVTTTPAAAPTGKPISVSQMRPELQTYATAMDWAAALVGALAMVLGAGAWVVGRRKRSQTVAAQVAAPVSPLKAAREQRRQEKKSRKMAGNTAPTV